MRPLRIADLFCGRKGWSKPLVALGHQVITLDYDASFEPDLAMDIREFAKDPQRYLDEVSVRKGWIQPGEHWLVDLVLSSPPCEAFTVATIGKMWEDIRGIAVPKHKNSILGLEILEANFTALHALNPTVYVIENPTAKMRVVIKERWNLRVLHHPDRPTQDSPSITYCQYGRPYRKMTDLWSNRPDIVKVRVGCRGKFEALAERLGADWNHLPAGSTLEVRAKGNELWILTPGSEPRLTAAPVYVVDENGKPCHEASPRGCKTQGIQAVKTSELRAEIPEQLALEVCAQVADALRGGAARPVPVLLEGGGAGDAPAPTPRPPGGWRF